METRASLIGIIVENYKSIKNLNILSRVQTLSELFDKDCIIINVITKKYIDALTADKLRDSNSISFRNN